MPLNCAQALMSPVSMHGTILLIFYFGVNHYLSGLFNVENTKIVLDYSHELSSAGPSQYDSDSRDQKLGNEKGYQCITPHRT